MTNTKKIMPSLFVTHGGGPCFFMDWNPPDTWTKTKNWLQSYKYSLPYKPKAILLISAHWEEGEFTIHTGEKPKLLYDYYGFPEHTYELEYKALGSPDLAEKVKNIFNNENINYRTENVRGWDHGVFIPLKVMFPDADIPVLQISLKNNLNPYEHIKLGESLRKLREEGILIIGSGSSFHNLRYFNPNGAEASVQFDDWLTNVITIGDKEKRNNALSNWEKSEFGKFSHPREEHLIPLMVIAGTALENENGKKVFSDINMGVTLSHFEFS